MLFVEELQNQGALSLEVPLIWLRWKVSAVLLAQRLVGWMIVSSAEVGIPLLPDHRVQAHRHGTPLHPCGSRANKGGGGWGFVGNREGCLQDSGRTSDKGHKEHCCVTKSGLEEWRFPASERTL